MKRMFLALGLATLLSHLTGCACLYEIEQFKCQTLGVCLHHGGGCGQSGYNNCGYSGGHAGGCSPCQGGYAQPSPINYAPQFQGGCGSCGGCGSYSRGTSYHSPSYGVSTYGMQGGTPWHGGGGYGGCSSCGTPTLQAPIGLPAR